MADRFALTVALALVTAPPVLAQAPAAPTAARYEVGGGIAKFLFISPLHFQQLLMTPFTRWG